ncbi:MAG: hypothetical protein JXA71_12745 [Chitinispirillaceae bacterium]|nr:hypothetical protein [Chitinispirillaceae bacterium]
MRAQPGTAFAFILSIALTAMSGPLQTKTQWGAIDWVTRTVTATGIGAPPPDVPIAAARPNALRAAQMTALRNALEIVKGIPLTSATTVENGIMSGDIVTAKIEGFLKGFEQKGKPKYMSDATVELVMEIPLDGGLAQDVLPKTVTDTPAIKKAIKTGKKKASFTGLIIDCTGLGLKPAMLPSVVDIRGQEIYGITTISRTWAVKWGAAAYVPSLDKAKAMVDRIGTKPRVIKGVKATGDHVSDVMISKKDGAAIRGNPANYSVLEECRILLIVD